MVSTGVYDKNGVLIYGGDKVQYCYYRCGNLRHNRVGIVEYGLDEDGVESWHIGGASLISIGTLDTKKDKETIEKIIE